LESSRGSGVGGYRESLAGEVGADDEVSFGYAK
jgi:hypothetical protein